jgi:hypothetical protein
VLTSDSSKAFNFFSPCGAETGGAAEEDEAGTAFKEETWRNESVRNVEVFLIDNKLRGIMLLYGRYPVRTYLLRGMAAGSAGRRPLHGMRAGARHLSLSQHKQLQRILRQV